MSLQQTLALREAQAVRSPGSLRPYQSGELIPFLIDNPFSGIFVDMGLGKTVSVLTMLNNQLSRGLINKVLIIAPLRVAVQTWPTEIAEWHHTWWMSYSLIRADPKHPGALAAEREAKAAARLDDFGSPNAAGRKAITAHMELQRRQLARSPQSIHIINREAVEWLVQFWGRNWPYDCVIVDESTSFSDHTTKRWEALNSVRKHIKRLHLLSGVPAPEGVGDYFAQIYLLDRGDRFGRGITNFRKRYMDYNHYTRKYTPKEGAGDAIAKKVADICIVMREEDYLDLGKPTVIERPIILSPAELKQYRTFEREMILELSDIEIEAENAAALSQKLLQFASGAVYDADRNVHAVHDHKLDELHQLVEEAQGSPLLVAYWHKSSLQRLRRSLPKFTVMDKDAKCLTDWNAGKLKGLFIHPASAGHGLNMQYGPGHILVFFDNPYPLELYMQTVKRIARPGQKLPVKVYHLTTRGTIDQLIVPLLMQKQDAQDTVRKYIRDLRRQYKETGKWSARKTN